MSENIISVYLKAAVNHLRTFNFAAIGTDHCSDSTIDAIEAVVKAYLAEHPADDSDPVTVEWLKDEWGFYGDDLITHRWISHSFRMYFIDRIGSGVVMFTGGDKHYRTRGEVRRLCRGLGLLMNPHRSNNNG